MMICNLVREEAAVLFPLPNPHPFFSSTPFLATNVTRAGWANILKALIDFSVF